MKANSQVALFFDSERLQVEVILRGESLPSDELLIRIKEFFEKRGFK